MKKILFVVAMLGMFFVGCQEANNSSITGPVIQQEKVNILPNLVNNSPSVTKVIDGSKGGIIFLSGNSIKGLSVKNVVARVKFAPGAFEGKKEITVTANFDDVSLSFYPHMVFDGKDKVKLNAKFTGIDLNLTTLTGSLLGYANKGVYFCYFGDNNSYQIIKNDGININNILSSISVKNAQLEHFSRYAWGNKM